MKLPRILRAGRRLSSLSVFPLAVLFLCLAFPRLGAQTNPLDLWTSDSSGYSSRGIACGGGQFVAAGDYGAIVTSADGTNWISRNSGTQDSLWGVVYGNAEFVVAGIGTILTSGTGTTKPTVRLALGPARYGAPAV